MPYRAGLSLRGATMHHLTWPDALVLSVALIVCLFSLGLLSGMKKK